MSYCGGRRPFTLPMRKHTGVILTPHTEASVAGMSPVWWASCVRSSEGPEGVLLSEPLPHVLIKRTLVCGRAKQTGKGLGNDATALLGDWAGIY